MTSTALHVTYIWLVGATTRDDDDQEGRRAACLDRELER
jgi:hypothetical protein